MEDFFLMLITDKKLEKVNKEESGVKGILRNV